MFKRIIFSLIAILLFFLLLECVSRLIYPFWYKKYQKEVLEEGASFYRHDPFLGWTLTPDFEGSRVVHGKKCNYKTNSLGLRDKEYSVQKPQGVYRIICLGDSITEGMAVDNDAAYPKLLEKKLNDKSPKTNFEVLNAGVVDYGTEQEYIFLKERGLKYAPDMVILGYFLNDARGFVPSKVIYFKKYDKIINKSKFLFLLDRMIMKYKIRYQYKIWEKDRHEFWMPFYEKNTWRSVPQDRRKLIELSVRDWGLAWTQKGWDRTREYLDKLLILRDKHNFKFAVVAFPIDIQLFAEENDEYMVSPQERLRRYCLENKVIFVDMLPVFKKYKRDELFLDYCHPLPLGLDLIADEIYSSIKKELPL